MPEIYLLLITIFSSQPCNLVQAYTDVRLSGSFMQAFVECKSLEDLRLEENKNFPLEHADKCIYFPNVTCMIVLLKKRFVVTQLTAKFNNSKNHFEEIAKVYVVNEKEWKSQCNPYCGEIEVDKVQIELEKQASLCSIEIVVKLSKEEKRKKGIDHIYWMVPVFSVITMCACITLGLKISMRDQKVLSDQKTNVNAMDQLNNAILQDLEMVNPETKDPGKRLPTPQTIGMDKNAVKKVEVHGPQPKQPPPTPVDYDSKYSY